MTQYYQLTPDILLEYIYTNDSGNSEINKNTNKDIHDDSPTMLLKSNMFGSKYLCFKDESEGIDSFPNLVLPINNSETQFVVAKSEYQNFFSKINASNIYTTRNGSGYMYEDTNYDKDIIASGESCDVTYDRCILHFTSRNYFGNYDALIFQTYAYMKNKSKLYFASFLFKKTSNLELKAEPLLYNEKLYAKQLEFEIPSVFAIFNNQNKDFNNALKSQNVELLENTPIGVNIYGVIGNIESVDKYVRLKTNKLNSISIPYIYNRLDEISVNIEEAKDGDYYLISPKMGSSYPSFVDYIESMGEDIRAYLVMHELQLRETWSDNSHNKHAEITHKECHIINIYDDDDDIEISKKFEEKIKYRPICVNGGLDYVATIIDTIKIMNTIDSSSYEVIGSLDIVNPYKYGKRLKRLDIKSENRPIVNVYNKKIDEVVSGSNLINTNRGGGFMIENNSQNITSFLESTNIGVSIVELSPEDIN